MLIETLYTLLALSTGTKEDVFRWVSKLSSDKGPPPAFKARLAFHSEGKRLQTDVAVFLSFSASGLARLSTLRNSATRCRMRLCM